MNSFMQINTSSWEFTDYIICYLLQALLEKNSSNFAPNDNPNHQQLIETMDRKSLKSILMMLFLRMDPMTKNRYKLFREAFNKKATSTNYIKVSPTEKKLNEEIKLDAKKKDVVDAAVKVTTQILQGKHDLNESKLLDLQNRVYMYLLDNDKL